MMIQYANFHIVKNLENALSLNSREYQCKKKFLQYAQIVVTGGKNMIMGC